jgi:hypothetical protein
MSLILSIGLFAVAVSLLGLAVRLKNRKFKVFFENENSVLCLVSGFSLMAISIKLSSGMPFEGWFVSTIFVVGSGVCMAIIIDLFACHALDVSYDVYVGEVFIIIYSGVIMAINACKIYHHIHHFWAIIIISEILFCSPYLISRKSIKKN